MLWFVYTENYNGINLYIDEFTVVQYTKGINQFGTKPDLTQLNTERHTDRQTASTSYIVSA